MIYGGLSLDSLFTFRCFHKENMSSCSAFLLKEREVLSLSEGAKTFMTIGSFIVCVFLLLTFCHLDNKCVGCLSSSLNVV